MGYKLGKLAPKIDARTLQFKDYLVTLPPIPAAIDWTGKLTVDAPQARHLWWVRRASR